MSRFQSYGRVSSMSNSADRASLQFDPDKTMLEDDQYRLALLRRIVINARDDLSFNYSGSSNNYPAEAYMTWLQGCLDQDQNYLERTRRQIDEYISANIDYANSLPGPVQSQEKQIKSLI
jgi:hypothetical protein